MRTVFTNGCFDIIHVGHVELLKHCHKLAYQSSYGGQGRVVVGLNSDHSVTRLKGTGRPVNNIHDRINVLSSLRYVDTVIVFDTVTPYNLIKQIMPDIIVKGGDYDPEEVVGSDLCQVDIFKYIPGKSTTDIINKLS